MLCNNGSEEANQFLLWFYFFIKCQTTVWSIFKLCAGGWQIIITGTQQGETYHKHSYKFWMKQSFVCYKLHTGQS